MSKTQKILEYLEHKKTITSLEAFKKFYVTRLSAIIYNLRKRGYKITTKTKCKDGTLYAVYHFEGAKGNEEFRSL